MTSDNVNRNSAIYSPGIRCQYGGCDQVIGDVSPQGVKAHFNAYHPLHLMPPDGDERTNCQWHTLPSPGHPDGACGSGILKTHVVRHVCNVHLRLNVRFCPGCLRKFTRPDPLRRHLDNPKIKCGSMMQSG